MNIGLNKKNQKKSNGSFIIQINGLPYNTTEGDRYYNKTLELYNSNPELFEIEKELETNLNAKKYIEELKLQKIREIKLNANIIIENNNNYPLFKQINIQRGYVINPEDQSIKEKFETMDSFINKVREWSNQMEEIVNELNTVKELNSFKIIYDIQNNKNETNTDNNNSDANITTDVNISNSLLLKT